MPRFSRTLTSLLCGSLLLTSMGCTTLHIPFLKDRTPKATARNPVTQIVCLWQPSEGRDPDGMPCRGFAGQILFLANRGALPVQMDGDVRIYLFDDQGTLEEQTKPLHQYDFDSKSWSVHLTKGTLGPTYSVFVPYTRRGTYEATCALRVRLKTADGQSVFSDLASIQLDGRKKSETDIAAIPSVEEAQAAVEAVSQSMRRTTTIPMDGKDAKSNVKDSGSTSKAVMAQGRTPAGQVQLANYEEGSAANDPNQQRIEHLEQLVHELRAQQANQAKGTAQRTESSPPPKLLDADSAAAERFRLTKPTGAAAQSSATHPTRTSASGDVEEQSVEPTSTTSASRSRAVLRHPLSEFEDDASPSPIRRIARKPREPHPHHPLADLDEELSHEDSLTPVAKRNKPQPVVRNYPDNASPTPIIRATTEPSEEHGWNDSFEPIDTGAIETTSLGSDETVRQRLRAAR